MWVYICVRTYLAAQIIMCEAWATTSSINFCITECVHHRNPIATKPGNSQMLQRGLMMGFPANGKWG